MIGLVFLSSRLQLAAFFFYAFVWIPLLHLKEAILAVAAAFNFASPPENGGGTLLERRYGELQRSDNRAAAEEEMCSICLTEFATEDSVCKLPDCSHVFHLSCIKKWLERNRITCPLCRCLFSTEKKKKTKKLSSFVPDDPLLFLAVIVRL